MDSFNIDSRKSDALTGSDFCKNIMNIRGQAREAAILNQFELGNVPDFMRIPVEVVVTNGTYTIKYLAMPDVLCIGSDQDYIRISASGYTYKKIADLFCGSMITNLMSRQIWEQADLKLTPVTWPGPFDQIMGATSTIVWHNQKIEEQRAGRQFNLITGHKKDMILSRDLLTLPKNICITGWYYPSGKQIQPKEARVHDEQWIDYADQVRLVSTTCQVNDQETNIYEVLADPNLCRLISDEGAYDARAMYE